MKPIGDCRDRKIGAAKRGVKLTNRWLQRLAGGEEKVPLSVIVFAAAYWLSVAAACVARALD